MTPLYLTSAVVAALTYVMTWKLRRIVRIVLALTIFLLLAGVPTIGFLLLGPDDPGPEARLIAPSPHR